MTPRISRSLLLAVLLTLFATPPARAAFIVTVDVTVTPPSSPGGLYQYEYLLTNDASSDQAAIVFTLDVSTAADLTSITGPSGWAIDYLPLIGNITWSSPDPAHDIQPGGTARLSFGSPLAPSDKAYAVFGENFDIVEGQIRSPGAAASGAVPAPAGLTLFGVASLCLGACAWWRKKPTDALADLGEGQVLVDAQGDH